MGDIVSISGHVWICLGQCEDGSVVLIHSTPNAGVQISGTQTRSGNADSEAVQQYMNFFDLEKEDWYTRSVEYMLKKGWMRGTGDGIFEPTGQLTRAQMIQILYHVSGCPQASHQRYFDDVDLSAWYAYRHRLL